MNPVQRVKGMGTLWQMVGLRDKAFLPSAGSRWSGAWMKYAGKDPRPSAYTHTQYGRAGKEGSKQQL